MKYFTLAALLALSLIQACGAPARQAVRTSLPGSMVIDSARFSVAFPPGCPVKYESESSVESYGTVYMQSWGASCDSVLPRSFIMELSTTDFPGTSTTREGMDDLLSGTREGTLKTLKGEVIHEARVDGGRTRGLELQFTGKIREKDAYFRYLLVCDGLRLYRAMFWTYDREQLVHPAVTSFFDSFSVRE